MRRFLYILLAALVPPGLTQTAPGLEKEQALFDAKADASFITESITDQLKVPLGVLRAVLEEPWEDGSAGLLGEIISDGVRVRAFQILPGRNVGVLTRPVVEQMASDLPFAVAIQAIHQLVPAGERSAYPKLYKIEPTADGYTTRILLELSGRDEKGATQINTEMVVDWVTRSDSSLVISGCEFEKTSAARLMGESPLFVDRTDRFLGSHDLVGVDQRVLTQDVMSGIQNPSFLGMSVIDIDGDFIDDVFICRTGGVENGLYLSREKGAESKNGTSLNYLDRTTSALFVDLDGDGDRDAILAIENIVAFHENVGRANFELRTQLSGDGSVMGLSATDYDGDGRLDLFVARYGELYGYQTDQDTRFPLPLNAATNGAANSLYQNAGTWQFDDVTEATRLAVENSRWSFGGAWQDIDGDGDDDLYIANDFGPDQCFLNRRKETGKAIFEPWSGFGKTGFGMSAAWGDMNRDGRVDLYVSNMFSGAGNRVTFQENFLPSADEKIRAALQEMNQGNFLYLSAGEGDELAFDEVAKQSGTAMGRWAWGAQVADLNNDGWLDIAQGNGFITQENTGDL